MLDEKTDCKALAESTLDINYIQYLTYVPFFINQIKIPYLKPNHFRYVYYVYIYCFISLLCDTKIVFQSDFPNKHNRTDIIDHFSQLLSKTWSPPFFSFSLRFIHSHDYNHFLASLQTVEKTLEPLNIFNKFWPSISNVIMTSIPYPPWVALQIFWNCIMQCLAVRYMHLLVQYTMYYHNRTWYIFDPIDIWEYI